MAQQLGLGLSAVTITHLADSEIHVQIDELVRHQDIFIIQPCAIPVNNNFMELLLLIDAFRRASARRINVVIPYFPYARQDRMSSGREALSAKVVAHTLETMGINRIIYVDIHALQIQGFFQIPVDPPNRHASLSQLFSKRPPLYL